MPGLGKFEMRKVFTLIFVCCAIGSSHAESEWNLIWHDEFDGRVLNSGKWRQEVGFLRNREVQYYTSGRKENLRVENGKLVIEARLEGFVNPAYDPQAAPANWQRARAVAGVTSASVTTKGLFSVRGGRIEFRAKVPKGRGVWPALWLLGDCKDRTGWPRCGELDVMEYVGHAPDVVHGTIHWQSPKSNAANGYDFRTARLRGKSPADGFHVYSAEWDEHSISFFYDGEMYSNVEFGSLPFSEGNPFVEPMYIIMNLAIGGSWGGEKGIDPTVFPARFEIDWVRVYAKKKIAERKDGKWCAKTSLSELVE